jgi:hypothetical protein
LRGARTYLNTYMSETMQKKLTIAGDAGAICVHLP